MAAATQPLKVVHVATCKCECEHKCECEQASTTLPVTGQGLATCRAAAAAATVGHTEGPAMPPPRDRMPTVGRMGNNLPQHPKKDTSVLTTQEFQTYVQ